MVCGLFVFGRRKDLTQRAQRKNKEGREKRNPGTQAKAYATGRKEGRDAVCYGAGWSVGV
jgi:hypothetical protein